MVSNIFANSVKWDANLIYTENMFYSFFHKIIRIISLYFSGIFLLLFSFSQIFSQVENDLILRGNIVDSNRLPIAPAKVKIIHEFGKESVCLTDN